MEKISVSLLNQIQNSIKENISANKIGIAFSGGVDSTLMAKICSDLGFKNTLLTIGFQDSHDIVFSKKVNQFLKQAHKILVIDTDEFEKVSYQIEEKIKTDNLSWKENCIAFYFIAKLASQLNLKTVVTANGIDELFCGYNAYREAIKHGEKMVLELMNQKIENEINMMKIVNDVCSEFRVRIVQPFLSQHFIDFAKKIPVSMKIKNPNDLVRKHVIRQLAQEIGVPDISANQRKKALQYGSQIHKALVKSK